MSDFFCIFANVFLIDFFPTDTTMIPTIDYLQRKFLEFNTLMFSGKLPVPPIQLSRARTFVGLCAFKKRRTILHGTQLYDFRLKFSICFDLPEPEWEDTIIHEMIHYYIGVNGLKDSSAHGPLFRQMMEQINQQFGRSLSISHKSTPEQKEQLYSARKVWHVIALIHFADGRKGLKVLPRIRQSIVTYRFTMMRDPRITSIDLFMSNDTYFNRFPNSSAFNVVLANEEEFMPHIQQAESLQL